MGCFEELLGRRIKHENRALWEISVQLHLHLTRVLNADTVDKALRVGQELLDVAEGFPAISQYAVSCLKTGRGGCQTLQKQ